MKFTFSVAMRNFLFVVCLFLLAGRAKALEFQFGDIIRFAIGHYGVALGQTGTVGKYSGGCEIRALDPSSEKRSHRRLDNYQDAISQPNLSEIAKRVQECRALIGRMDKSFGTCCGKYSKLLNNCEHTASYIRYGSAGRVSCMAYSYFHVSGPSSKCRDWKPWLEARIDDALMSKLSGNFRE